jgi:SAM-dependent methyltransferase
MSKGDTTPQHAPDGWTHPGIVANYEERSYILPAEVRALAECVKQVDGGHVLDVGVGAGRTIPFIGARASRYVAIDRSAPMVEAARVRYPHADIRIADVLALPFEDGEFSFAIFSFNGIDYIDPDDRPRALDEIARVLRPGGRFVFSTHNLRARRNVEGRFELNVPNLSPNPVRTAVRLLRAARYTIAAYRNFRRLRRFERVEPDIAFVNDGAHDYALLTCYISPTAQVLSLERAGFTLLHIFGQDGNDATVQSKDAWLHFVAEKR